MKFYSTCIICFMCLLLPVSGFAGFGDWVGKIRRALKPNKVSEVELTDQVFELDLRQSIRHITGKDLPENATRQDVLEGFREAYIQAAADTRIAPQSDSLYDHYRDYPGAGLYDYYRGLIFRDEWWEVDDFREIMFPILLKEDLVGKHGNPVNLMKWLREARLMGVEGRLSDFTLSSFRKYGISMEDIIIRKNGVIDFKSTVKLN